MKTPAYLIPISEEALSPAQRFGLWFVGVMTLLVIAGLGAITFFPTFFSLTVDEKRAAVSAATPAPMVVLKFKEDSTKAIKPVPFRQTRPFYNPDIRINQPKPIFMYPSFPTGKITCRYT